MKSSTLDEQIQGFLRYLEEEFDFVMVLERLDESLMVLKEYLGWDMRDLLYIHRMPGKKRGKEKLSEKTEQRILLYNTYDEQVYYHFNKTLDEHIVHIGEAKIADLLNDFRKKQQNFEDECETALKERKLGESSPACEFLYQPDHVLNAATTELQLSNDYDIEIQRETDKAENYEFNICAQYDACIVKRPVKMKKLFQNLQNDY